MHIHTFVTTSDYPPYWVCASCGSYYNPLFLVKRKGAKHSFLKRLMQQDLLCANQSLSLDELCKIVESFGINSPVNKILHFNCSADGHVVRVDKTFNCNVTSLKQSWKNLDFNLRQYTGVQYPEEYYLEKEILLINRFDYVVASDTIGFIENYYDFFLMISRLLKDKGRFAFTSPVIFSDQDILPQSCVSDYTWIFSKLLLTRELTTFFSEIQFYKSIKGQNIVICVK